jgi:hypothetical protein
MFAATPPLSQSCKHRRDNYSGFWLLMAVLFQDVQGCASAHHSTLHYCEPRADVRS